MPESHGSLGVEPCEGREGRENGSGSRRHESRHSKQPHCHVCGQTDPDRFYKSLRTTCKECQKAKMRAHYKTEGYRELNTGYQRKRTADPTERMKRAARGALAKAVKRGEIERPIWCEDCGILGPTHGHHEDYRKPLEVNWLCRPCHAKRHDGYVKKTAAHSRR